MVSSRCEWNFKDLAVAQSHKASRQRRGEGIFFLQLSLCMSPAESVAQIKGVYHHAWNWDLLYPRWSPAESVAQIKGVYHLAWNWDLLYPRWPWTPYISILIILEFTATLPENLHAKIQGRNSYLSASKLGSQVSLPIPGCISFQI